MTDSRMERAPKAGQVHVAGKLFALAPASLERMVASFASAQEELPWEEVNIRTEKEIGRLRD